MLLNQMITLQTGKEGKNPTFILPFPVKTVTLLGNPTIGEGDFSLYKKDFN